MLVEHFGVNDFFVFKILNASESTVIENEVLYKSSHSPRPVFAFRVKLFANQTDSVHLWKFFKINLIL